MNRFVEKISAFGNLAPADIAVLTDVTDLPRQVPKLRDLIREGDKPDRVIVVLDGWACRYKVLPTGTRQIMAFLMPGDSCDLHIGLLREMDHSIQTLSTAQIATIPRARMEAMLVDHPAIARAMYVSQLVDEGTLRAWIVSMGRRNSLERVAHLMCELYLRAHDIGLTVDTTLELPLSQTVLADALGLTPVHINRVLKTLRIDGAMTLQRGSLKIEDPLRLARIAGFDENYLHRRLSATAAAAA